MDHIFSKAIDKLKNKEPFVSDIEKDTADNDDFFRVVYTGPDSQISLVSLKPKEDIGMESHPQDQFFRVEDGEGECEINGEKYDIGAGMAVLIPGGAEHNVTNTSKFQELKLYIIYSPPKHEDGAFAEFKADDKD